MGTALIHEKFHFNDLGRAYLFTLYLYTVKEWLLCLELCSNIIAM